MIPAIGVMIGCYIITRMAQVLLGSEQEWARGVSMLLAAITILVTALMMAQLITGSQSANEGLGGLNNPASSPFGQGLDTMVIFPPEDP
jgi:hypothetical protein